MIDTERIRAMAKALDGTAVVELLVVENESEIRLSRSLAALVPLEAVPAEAHAEEQANPSERLIVARRVGVYHRPQRPVHAGDRIEAGEIVGFIEAMRILNEVVADHSGVVAQAFVEDGSPVEYGQELFLLKETGNEAA